MIFGKKEQEWKELKGLYTASEIAQQPGTWLKTISQVNELQSKIEEFIGAVINNDDYEIILTGAGTSEYVGNALCPALIRKYDGRIRSVGTTDLVSSPRAYLPKEKPVLIVSFARSGNSPESVGAVLAADAFCSNARHLFITCNAEGELAKMADKRDDCFPLVLTPETHDQSFVMTSSFSNMYIAALLILGRCSENDLKAAASAAYSFLNDEYAGLRDFIADGKFDRFICLGTDVLKGIAQESALKMMEITAGSVVSIFDTAMGFRHGPKSVICDKALTLLYLSETSETRRYEMDLLAELSRDRQGSKIIAVSAHADPEVSRLADYVVSMNELEGCDNSVLAPAYISVAQTLALLYSIQTGNTPDNPCPSGEVNRVVKGVTIYDFKWAK